MTRRRNRRNLNTGDRKFRKVVVSYRCVNNHNWESVHGWVDIEGSNAQFDCDACQHKTKVVEAKVTELFTGTCSSCGSCWHVPLSDEADTRIPCCRGSIDYQRRVCNYYVHRCTNAACLQEWTDATVEKVYTQRCRKCGNKGAIVGRRPFNAANYGRRDREARGDSSGGGGHNPDLCDMCIKIQEAGLGVSCTRNREVRTRKHGQPDENGEIQESVVSVD